MAVVRVDGRLQSRYVASVFDRGKKEAGATSKAACY